MDERRQDEIIFELNSESTMTFEKGFEYNFFPIIIQRIKPEKGECEKVKVVDVAEFERLAKEYYEKEITIKNEEIEKLLRSKKIVIVIEGFTLIIKCKKCDETFQSTTGCSDDVNDHIGIYHSIPVNPTETSDQLQIKLEPLDIVDVIN